MGKQKVRSENRKRNRFLKQKREREGFSSAADEAKKRDEFDGVAENEIDNFDLDKDHIFLEKKGRQVDGGIDEESDEEEVYELGGVGSSGEEEEENDFLSENEEEEDEEYLHQDPEDSRMYEEEDDAGSVVTSDLEMDESGGGGDVTSGDEEAEEEDDSLSTLRASKAWGSKSKAYYGSDYQRQKKRTREEADELEDAEEEAAIKHKRHMLSQLGEEDFQLDMYTNEQDRHTGQAVEAAQSASVKVEPSLVTKEERVANLKLRHPELEHMIEEYNSLNEELHTDLKTTVAKIDPSRPEKITEKKKIAQLKYTVYTHYLMCLSVYFMLKMNKEPTENHPVMEKLLDFRRYISKLNKIEKNVVPSQKQQTIVAKKSDIRSNKSSNESTTNETDVFDLYEKLTMLQDSKKTAAKERNEALKKEIEMDREKAIERKRSAETKLIVEKNGVSKRKVTKPIRVNKSVVEIKNLMARKEKNPRTRNRKKSLIANLQRRGQVRPMRDASVNYSGETTGINVQAKRGTKLT